MISSETTIKVRYAETDAGGIAYHSNYLIWLDIARTEMIRELGLCYKTLEAEEQVHLAVIEANVKYLKSALFDDELKVKAMIMDIPKVRTTIDYEIFRENDLIATGQTRHAFINKNQEAVKPPERFTKTIKENLLKFAADTSE